MPTKTWGPFNGRQLTTIIVALIAGAVLIPTGASAVTALTHVDIQDKLTRTPAVVTPTGNLKVAEAAPSAFFHSGSSAVASDGFVPVASPPGGSALIITTVRVNTYADPTPGTNELVEFLVESDTACTGSQVGNYIQGLNPPSIGETDIPLSPGLGIPAGDALCARAFGSVRADVSVSGYTVAAGTVAAASLHALPALPQQR